MNIARLELILRLLGGIIAAAIAWEVGRPYIIPFISALSSSSYFSYSALSLLVLISFATGFVFTPHLTSRPFFWLLNKVTSTPMVDIAAAAGGLSIGLLLGVLLAWPLSLLPFFGGFLPMVASLVLGYLGMITVMSHKRDVLQLIGTVRVPGTRSRAVAEPSRVLVDTSAIIDGRIADITRTGFMPGPLVVPRFVLHELQGIADSSDGLKRNRGRRGLDVLDRLQRQPRVPFEVLESELERGQDVDSQLVRLARTRGWSIVTNDFNLNRVASIQGVNVLNVNELANAVKSVLLPGEEMSVHIIQEGKEHGQGVAYLEDGTMVVVENGRRHLHSEVEIVVQRVLQTAAGRMVFAQPRGAQTGKALL